MLQDKVDQLKRETSYVIMGAYLAGVAENVAVIDKKTPLKTLGESFCLYDDKQPIDFTKRNLVDLNDFGSAPESGGVTSTVISQANEKIQKRAESLARYNLSQVEQEAELAKYAKKVQQAAVIVAKGEGALDNDLKEDFRVLLKEAKNEFIKREQEEEVEEEPTFGDMPEEGMDDEFNDEEGLEDFSEDPGDDEFGFEEDENSTEDVENGTGTEQPENGEEAPEDEDFGVPSGKFESSYIKPDGRTASGELFKGQRKVKNLYLDYMDIRQRGYELQGKSKDELSRLVADTLEDYITSVNQNVFDPEKFRTVGKIVKNKDGSNSVVITKPLTSLNHYIDSIFSNNNIEEIKFNNDWKKTSGAINRDYTIGSILGGIVTLGKIVRDAANGKDMSVLTMLFPAIMGGLFATTGRLLKKAKIRLSDKEGRKPEVRYINLLIAKKIMGEIIDQNKHLIKQAEERISNGDKLAAREKKSFEKSIKVATNLISNIEKEINKLEPKVNSILEANGKKEAVAESFNIKDVFQMDEEEFSRALANKNVMLPFSENSKYLYKGNVISTSPYDLQRMVSDVIDIENTSIQMLGESYKLSNVINNDQLALKHKTTVNELAIVIAARNKFGFR